jgi:hypothetical protein
MTGYYGTELQKKLQQRTYENRGRIAGTPGLYNAGRFIGTDDPDKVGWPTLRSLLREQDGVLGFRLVSRDQARRYFPLAVEEGCRVDRWDVFCGTTETVRPRIEAIMRSGLPAGIVQGWSFTDPQSEETAKLQEFAAANGVAPLPGSLLVEAPGQATAVLVDRRGTPVAVANTYFAHNRYSPHHRSAWVGMVAVEKSLRGLGLGRYVSAVAIWRAATELGAESVHELISGTNEPSRRMAVACGLAMTPELVVGVAVPSETASFTR